jgi:hypothetical protein
MGGGFYGRFRRLDRSPVHRAVYILLFSVLMHGHFVLPAAAASFSNGLFSLKCPGVDLIPLPFLNQTAPLKHWIGGGHPAYFVERTAAGGRFDAAFLLIISHGAVHPDTPDGDCSPRYPICTCGCAGNCHFIDVALPGAFRDDSQKMSQPRMRSVPARRGKAGRLLRI